jgi:hypothetical protein
MKKPIISPESTAEEPLGEQTSLESVIRVIFGACTGADIPQAERTYKRDVGSETSSRSREKSKSTCEPTSPNPSQEDAMYAQLCRDEQFRAEEAVSHLREQMEQRKEERSPHRQSPPHSKPTKSLHKFFPASSPSSPKKEREITVPTLVRDSPPPPKTRTNKKPHAPQNMSFDDGISAISAHTLDDMARMYEVDANLLNRVHSDLTQDYVDTGVENWHGTAYRNGGMPSSRHGAVKMSPVRLARAGRSQGSIITKHSRGTRSFATKSTLSTQTNEFISVFRKNEQNYWQDVADEQDDPAFSARDVMNHETIMKTRQMRRSKDADLVSYTQCLETQVVSVEIIFSHTFSFLVHRNLAKTARLLPKNLRSTRAWDLNLT